MPKDHIYRNLSKEEQEELFSNFLVDSWSYSKLGTFARNEKAFEMNYIYNVKSKRSASTVAGQAYHAALDGYFFNMQDGNALDLVDMQQIAYNYIEEVPANEWKCQKTTPTIESCIIKANNVVTGLLENFHSEINVYDFKEILYIEHYVDQFITVNGVDIPLPCHARIDLVIKTMDDKIAIVDHKSKSIFSDEKELAFSIGKQAITYYHCLEAATGLVADQVWFVENKDSKNRDKSPQLSCFKMDLDDDTIRLYDAMLYEPLKRMMEAVSNPDYVYLMNESDNYVDKAELHDFWAQTMIAEVEDFDIPESKHEMISRRLKKIRDASLATISPTIIKNFRKNASQFIQYDLSNKDMTREEKIEHVLRSMGVLVKVTHKFEGYSNDTYLLETSAGINLSSVHRYKLDIANALNVPSIRIKKELFIYEDKSYLAVEAPKKRTKDLIFDKKYLDGYKIPIGLDNFQQPVIWDLQNHSTPHMLVCGATGSGKSVSIISVLEYALLAGISEVVIFDPKYEFVKYKSSKVTVYNEIEDIETVMELLVEEMNERVKSGISELKLVIFDEFADALAQSSKGKELDVYEDVVAGYYKQSANDILNGLPPQPKMKREKVGTKKSLEENLKVLGQKGRSSGYRMLAATQRASVKVITGDAKVNFPVQVCYKVPKEIDSKVVLGEGGAETLTGRGDGLISSPEYLDLVRFQSFYKP